MAQRPWIQPADVRVYSAFEDVRKRPWENLQTDILRAEEFVIRFTGNSFAAAEFETVPEKVRTACVLLAEAFAHNAVMLTKGVKKETFDEYSYEAENSFVDIAALGLDSLLREYVLATGTVTDLKLRRL
ncbi:MAG: DUF3199 family protein [Oscillospiraceae bacterium]|jgi:hypothetical protein|nr:DUF3199 family protein [Oscillospiraceae bacterium]